MGCDTRRVGEGRVRGGTHAMGMLIALATVISTIAVGFTGSVVQAALPPVARADVARTNAGVSTAQLFVLANDFDPDGGALTLVGVSTPVNGVVTSNGSFINSYVPNAGFSGVETLTYTIRDNEGLTTTGTLTVVVDSGSASVAQSPDPQTDYFYVYQGSSVGFSAAQLLDNDTDPNGHALTVVAVSEPGNTGTLSGNVTDGWVVHAGQRGDAGEHRRRTRLPRHRHRRSRHPRGHHHPHPRRRRHQLRAGGAGGCGADECGGFDCPVVRACQ